MAQITMRLSDGLLEDIEEATEEEESRSAFIRRAVRVEASRRGVRPEPDRSRVPFEEYRERLDVLEERVDRLEEARRPWWHRIFKSRR